MRKRGDVREAARIIAGVRADRRAAGLIDAELPAAGVLTGLLLREGRHREVIPVLLDSLRRLDERNYRPALSLTLWARKSCMPLRSPGRTATVLSPWTRR